MNGVPKDVWKIILSYLGPISLFHVNMVNRYFRGILDNSPELWKIRLNRFVFASKFDLSDPKRLCKHLLGLYLNRTEFYRSLFKRQLLVVYFDERILLANILYENVVKQSDTRKVYADLWDNQFLEIGASVKMVLKNGCTKFENSWSFGEICEIVRGVLL